MPEIVDFIIKRASLGDLAVGLGRDAKVPLGGYSNPLSQFGTAFHVRFTRLSSQSGASDIARLATGMEKRTESLGRSNV